MAALEPDRAKVKSQAAKDAKRIFELINIGSPMKRLLRARKRASGPLIGNSK
jgi:hypothetical protein